jgi:hypothetical protein
MKKIYYGTNVNSCYTARPKRGEINTYRDDPMLKKIDSSQLRVGMAIHDLDCGWMEHPFVRNRFVITSEDEIRKILNAGIRGVTSIARKGLDVERRADLEPKPAAAPRPKWRRSPAKPVAPLRATLAEEFERAVAIRARPPAWCAP